jgi:hypothetical protein
MAVALGLALVCVGIAVAGAAAAALIPTTSTRLATIGAVLALATWAAFGIVIYRGPDNPDLGEFGWTIMAGFFCVGFLAAWMIGVIVGCLLRRPRATR